MVREEYVQSVARQLQVIAGLVLDGGDERLFESIRDSLTLLTNPPDLISTIVSRHLAFDLDRHVGHLVPQTLARQLKTCSVGPCVTKTANIICSAESRSLRNRDPWLVARALAEIEQAEGNISVHALSRRIGCHSRTLERAFNRVRRETIRTALGRIRRREALRLVSETDLKLEAIGYEVGLRSRTSVRAAVKRASGRTPAALRRTR